MGFYNILAYIHNIYIYTYFFAKNNRYSIEYPRLHVGPPDLTTRCKLYPTHDVTYFITIPYGLVIIEINWERSCQDRMSLNP